MLTIEQFQRDSNRIAQEHGFWDLFDWVGKHYDHKVKTEISEQIIESKLMLIVGEVAEAEESLRHNDPTGFAVELADIMIRVADLAGKLDINLTEEILKKQAINEKRPYKHGKRF